MFLSSMVCFASAAALFLNRNVTLCDPVVATIYLGRSQLREDYCAQDVMIRFHNASDRSIRIIGFTPFCCSGQFGFAVRSIGNLPPQLAPGEGFTIECEAEFSKAPKLPDDRLERVAGQLLMDINDILVRQDVTVCIFRSNALSSCDSTTD